MAWPQLGSTGAALLLCITYMIFPQVDWGFVFVDDVCWLLRSGTANIWATTILATYTALGVPLSWKKKVLSEINTWLGFVINPRTLAARMATEKHDIIMEILSQLRQGDVFTSKAMRKHWAGSAGQLPCAHYPDIQTIPATLLGVEGCMQNIWQTAQIGHALCHYAPTHFHPAIPPTLTIHRSINLVGCE